MPLTKRAGNGALTGVNTPKEGTRIPCLRRTSALPRRLTPLEDVVEFVTRIAEPGQARERLLRDGLAEE